VELSSHGEPVKLLAEATLTVVLFADASRIDLRTLRTEIGIPARLLGIGLPLTLIAGLAAAVALFAELSWAEALLLAVILAPTDAALGQAVVTLPRLPSRIRQGLNVESGLNDGICVPLFFIVLAVAEAEAGAIGNGAAARLVLEQIGYGLLAGAIAGAAAAAAVLAAQRSAPSMRRGSRSARSQERRSPTASRRRSAAPGSSRRSPAGWCSAGCCAGARTRSCTSWRRRERCSARSRSSCSERCCSVPRSGI
jgi:hypothetical protein